VASPTEARRTLRWAARIAVPAVLLLTAMVLHSRHLVAPALFLSLNHAAAAWPDRLWSGLTDLGHTGVAVGLLAPLLLWRPAWFMAVLLTVPFGSAFARIAKLGFDAPRPAALLDPTQFHVIGPVLTSQSFPSGHTITAFALAAAISGACRPRRAALTMALLLLATLIGLSRIAVGAHWPLDVLAGAAGGWLSGCCGVALLQRWPMVGSALLWRHVGGVVLALTGLSLWSLDTGYPLGDPLRQVAVALALVVSVWQLVLVRATK